MKNACCIVYTPKEKFTVYMKLNELKEKLPRLFSDLPQELYGQYELYPEFHSAEDYSAESVRDPGKPLQV